MRAIAVSHDCKAELAIAIAKQESRITWNAATVSDVAIAVAHLRPPGQTKAGGFIAPKIFVRSFELIVLARGHLFQSRLADEPLVFVNPSDQNGIEAVNFVCISFCCIRTAHRR